MMIFDHEDGGFLRTLSDSMSMASDGGLMMEFI